MEFPDPPLDALLDLARAAGAHQADALAAQGRSLSVTVREGAIEGVDDSTGTDIGLRVILDGGRQACVSSSDISPESLRALAERCVAMAKAAPEDPYAGLAPEGLLAPSGPDLRLPDLQLEDPSEITAETLLDRAKALEASALSIDGVRQAEGARASAARSRIAYQTVDVRSGRGFSGGWGSTRHSLSVSAIAGDGHESGGGMERDYDAQGERWFADLPAPEAVGRRAGERAVARLGARQISSTTLPVIFDRRESASLLTAFLGAISGTSVARGVSFLKDRMGERVFAPDITITDDPLRLRGHGSRPWDGEGVGVMSRHLVDSGVLTGWMTNCAAARQLGLVTSGHAHRTPGSPPGIAPTNTYIAPGSISPEALIAETGSGLFVTEMFGPSINPNTGDYSVGVAGYAVEGGAVAHPVSEITVAGNLLEMYAELTAADDLVFDGAVVAPTLRVAQMAIAGA